MNTLAADFYTSFVCKCGECRHACCVGWPVNVTMDEYFRLIGLECSPELRRRLDCGMILRGGGEQEYAFIHHNYTGECHMRRDDGLCAIQRELGEEVLPRICRMYPRSCTSWDDGYKIALANSCEKTVEMLFDRKEKIGFEYIELSLPAVKQSGSREIGREYIPTLQDRTKRLGERIATLTGCEAGSISECFAAAKLMLSLAARSRNAEEIATEALDIYTSEEVFAEKMRAFSESDEILFEHLLVNHVFFSNFTSADIPSLAAVYLLLKSLYCSREGLGKDEKVDLISEAFRFIEHSPFPSAAMKLCESKNINTGSLTAI